MDGLSSGFVVFIIIVFLFLFACLCIYACEKIGGWYNNICDFSWMNTDYPARGKNKMQGKEKNKEMSASLLIDALIKEIIKARYCEIILDNPPMDEGTMAKRVANLKKLESSYPEFKHPYSPTQYFGHDERKAIEAYGAKEWSKLKRTMNLTCPVFGDLHA